jgi:hypothetical protein
MNFPQTFAGDFLVCFRHRSILKFPLAARPTFGDTHGTTVIAVKYRDGVLNVAIVAPRRAWV